MKYAACLLIRFTNGDILGISRRENPNTFGMVGGKVEPDESVTDAALRECFEETGLSYRRTDLRTLHSEMNEGFMVCTLAVVPRLEESARIICEPGLSYRALRPSMMLDPTVTPFSDYHTRMFESLARFDRDQMVIQYWSEQRANKLSYLNYSERLIGDLEWVQCKTHPRILSPLVECRRNCP